MNLKKLVVWCCIIGAVYLLLANHFVFVGSKLRILKKSSLTLEDTFFSTQGKTIESVLSVKSLRKAGIGQVLVEMGRISEEDLEKLTEKVEEAQKEKG